MHINIYICMYMYIYINMYIDIYVCIYMNIPVCILMTYTHIHVCMYIRTSITNKGPRFKLVCVYMYVQICR